MKKLSIYIVSLCFIISIHNFSQKSRAQMKVGVAVVDITGGGAKILDPLNVKAMVFSQDGQQAAVVVCDVSGVSGEISSQARKLASEKSGIPVSNICIAASHTHMGRPHKDLTNPIVEAILKAKNSLRPVKLQTCLAHEYTISFNRRNYMKDGTIMFNPMFLNPDIVRPAGPIDPEVVFILFRDSNGRAVASFTNFALHLDTVKEYGSEYQKTGVGGRNWVSADYPYWLEESLRKEFGSGFVSFFGTGCCGNINHWDFSKPGPQMGHKKMTKHLGESLAAAIKKELPNLEREKPSLAVLCQTVHVPLQTYTDEDLEWAKNMQSKKLSGKSEELTERQSFLNRVKMRRILGLDELKKKGQTILPLDVQVFRISDETVIVTLPGEMFVEHALSIKYLSPFKNTMVIELANNTCGYVPNKKAFPQGEYEVENSRLAPGGGEMLVKTAIHMLNEIK